MSTKFEIYEDNAGGLHLIVLDQDSNVIYAHAGYEYGPMDQLQADIEALLRGDDTSDWDGNQPEIVEAYPAEYEVGPGIQLIMTNKKMRLRAAELGIITNLTIQQAISIANEDYPLVSARGLRYAASRGYIPGARKLGRDWLIPYEGLNHYLDNRPKPGRK